MGAILGVSWEVIGLRKDIVKHEVFVCVFLFWEAGNRQSRVAKLNLSVFLCFMSTCFFFVAIWQNSAIHYESYLIFMIL